MVKDSILSQMEIFMSDILVKARDKEKDLIDGLIQAFMMDNGVKTNSTAMEFISITKV
jgi:hypothetical protein